MDLLRSHGVVDCKCRLLHQVQGMSCKGKEKVGETPFMADLSSGSSHANMDSNGSDQSLDEEFGIPAVRTPGVRKAQEDALWAIPFSKKDTDVTTLLRVSCK